MSFIKDVESFFDKVFKSTTTEQKVLATAGAIAPLVEAGLAFEGDAQAAQVVQQAFTAAQTDLGTFVAIVQTWSLRPAGAGRPRAHAGSGCPAPSAGQRYSGVSRRLIFKGASSTPTS